MKLLRLRQCGNGKNSIRSAKKIGYHLSEDGENATTTARTVRELIPIRLRNESPMASAITAPMTADLIAESSLHTSHAVLYRPVMRIRSIAMSDLGAFKALRLEALRNHPEAFGSDHDESAAEP